jgi:hypothetical protein
VTGPASSAAGSGEPPKISSRTIAAVLSSTTSGASTAPLTCENVPSTASSASPGNGWGSPPRPARRAPRGAQPAGGTGRVVRPVSGPPPARAPREPYGKLGRCGPSRS